MIDSLYKVNISWAGYFIFLALVYLAFPGLSVYSFLAIAIAMHQFMLLVYSIGSVIPIRYLFGALMCLQMLVGPMLAYNGLDKYQVGLNQMQIPESQYFEYVIPAVICFILGLHIFSNRLSGERPQQDMIAFFADTHKEIIYILIGVGFVASILADLFSADLAFVFYLLGSFKFIGAFMLLMGRQQLKILPLVAIYGSILISSLGSAMFHDLIIWVLFLAIVFSLQFHPSTWLKFVLIISFSILAAVIQLAKGDYRSALGEQGQETGIQTFAKAYEESKGDNDIVDLASLAKNNLRINQGYIIANIMKTVPASVPFENGAEMRLIIESAVLPRILAPNKLNAGDQKIFTKYSGLMLNKRTSMGLSSVGDAYINYGVVGGCVFMLILGLLYNFVLKGFQHYGKYYPALLLFTPLVFYYPIRPDCELQTILGHLVKSVFLIFIVFFFWKKYFKINTVIQ